MGQSGIMNKIPGLIRYCESELPNEHCPYINLGCMGCLTGFYSDLDNQPDNPQDYFHNDYDLPSRGTNGGYRQHDYQSDNPQSYHSDER
jgi:hypothetical protein